MSFCHENIEIFRDHRWKTSLKIQITVKIKVLTIQPEFCFPYMCIIQYIVEDSLECSIQIGQNLLN